MRPANLGIRQAARLGTGAMGRKLGGGWKMGRAVLPFSTLFPNGDEMRICWFATLICPSLSDWPHCFIKAGEMGMGK